MTTECPTCRQPVHIPADEEPMGTYPFCCERCKLVDLGRWLDGRYQIPVVEKDESDPDGAADGDDVFAPPPPDRSGPRGR